MVDVIEEIKENVIEGGEEIEELIEKGEKAVKKVVEEVEEKLRIKPKKKSIKSVLRIAKPSALLL